MTLLSLTNALLPAEHLVLLLDEIHKAQNYWTQVASASRAYFWKAPLAGLKNIFNQDDWKSTIAQHQTVLAKHEKEIIIFLAEYTLAHKKSDFLDFNKRILTHKKSLKLHGIPSHFTRNWATYAGLAATCTALGMYLSYFHNSYTLFILDPACPSLLSALQNNAPFLGHDYVDYKGQQYLQVTKNQEELARQFLEHRSIQFSVQSPDIRLCFYNEKGITRLWEFINKHGLQPTKEIVKILKNEAPLKMPINATDPQAEQQMFERRLDILLDKAARDRVTAHIVHEYRGERSLESLSFPEKNTLFTKLFMYTLGEYLPEQITPVLHELNVIMEQTSAQAPFPDVWGFKTVNEASVDAALIRAIKAIIQSGLNQNSGIVGLIFQIASSRVQQRELQIGASIHHINMFTEQVRLNIELSAMIPLALTSYCCYSLFRFLYETVAHKSFKIIKKDLVSFELLLNKNRYNKLNTTDSDLEYAGLSFYWLARLVRHTASIPHEQQSLYKNYLEQLQSLSLSAEQKLRIIDCMFKELTFLR